MTATRTSTTHDRPTRPTTARGTTWDHVAFDAESRLVVSVVPGERTAENVEAVVEDFRRRTGGRLMDLITTDDYPAYEDGDPRTPTARRSRRPGPASGAGPRPRTRSPPAGLTYADGGEDAARRAGWSRSRTRVVFGTMAAVLAALGMSKVEPGDQHGVRGAAERDGPAPQRPEGAEDVPVQRRTGGITRRSPT